MIDQLTKNRLIGEKEALLDEVAEEIRLGNIPTGKIEEALNIVYEKHDECLQVLKDFPDADVQDVILTFRGLVRNSIK
jgi:ribosomal 50S subunit-associated protein YjgA (DUF615 family)